MSSKNNQLTISQKLEQLEKLVAWFDSEDFVLEKALEQYKSAEKLADEITEELNSLQNEVTVLKKRFDED